MTLDEFLSWEDGTDARYELWSGTIVAMAPHAGLGAGDLVNGRALRRHPVARTTLDKSGCQLTLGLGET